jgi:drug/metabolite transporter (DMT)-like permease
MMIATTQSKLLRYVVCAFAAAGGLGAVFVLGKRVQRKEVFILLAVFGTVLLTINGIHAVFLITQKLITQNKENVPAAGNTFAVNFETPSPNIYWLFMDGMLGFEGMERLFGDS